MPAEVDRARRDVDVHEVVHYTALDVVLDTIHQISGAHVEDLNVREMPTKQEGIGSKNMGKLLGGKKDYKTHH